jgi:hypothetical protein
MPTSAIRASKRQILGNRTIRTPSAKNHYAPGDTLSASAMSGPRTPFGFRAGCAVFARSGLASAGY